MYKYNSHDNLKLNELLLCGINAHEDSLAKGAKRKRCAKNLYN